MTFLKYDNFCQMCVDKCIKGVFNQDGEDLLFMLNNWRFLYTIYCQIEFSL